jgi:hypothetical protein
MMGLDGKVRLREEVDVPTGALSADVGMVSSQRGDFPSKIDV